MKHVSSEVHPYNFKWGSFPVSAYTDLQAALYIIHLATKQVARSPRKAIRVALSNTPTLLASRWASDLILVPLPFGADLPPVPSLDPPRNTVCQYPSRPQPPPPSKLGGDSPACRAPSHPMNRPGGSSRVDPTWTRETPPCESSSGTPGFLLPESGDAWPQIRSSTFAAAAPLRY